MKNFKFIFAVFAVLSLLAGCEKGDPTALKEAVRLASLNISSITVEPADATITTGSSYQFSATGYRPDGSTTDITNSVVWSSSNETIATVNSNGLITTATDGNIVITASLSSLDGSTSLTASSAPLQSIEIFADTATPGDLSVSACKDLQLKAIGTYQGEPGPRDLTPITNDVDWTVDNNANGSIGNSRDIDKGLLSTFTNGTIGVQASLDGVDSALTSVTANADLSSIAIEPANNTLGVNGTLTFAAMGTYSDTSTTDITNNTAWTSSEPTVANFITPNSNNLITALATGTTIVTATCGTDPQTAIEGTTGLTVSVSTVNNVLFVNENDSGINPLDIEVGQTVQVVLKAYFTDGTSEDVTESAQWSVFNNTGNVVSVNDTTDNKGEVTGVAAGLGIIEATYQQRDYYLTVNVSEP